MQNRRTILGAAAAVAAFFSVPALAATDLATFVNQIADEAITTLSKADPTDPARAAALKPILLKYFDMQGMARHVLGAYWKKISPEQQEAFVGQFTNYMASVYGQRFKAYKGQKLEVKRVRDQGPMATVFTAVAEGSEDAGARVDWEVKNDGAAPLVADIRVEGLSLADTHRQEFTSVLSQHNGDITALMGILKNKSLVN
ncbi:MlaC/ttg2D family ABC transporter substrate-binding protein [Dongia sedimenti]|uniref:ABC transporter substrate-binding protein n=1 Tax=Dongia sedimenti TaxID=3064282 RepID=A0ABU0YI92_9PROT|nr:ABC transporter substrate-binding protein [Rhodospirillaceae bacterium R-7]